MFTTIILLDLDVSISKRRRFFTGPYRWTPPHGHSRRVFYAETLSLDIETARHGAGFRLRLEHANMHLAGSRLSHVKGYYASPFDFGETAQPIIARLPRGRGFLAGWSLGPGMASALETTVWDNPRDAAWRAHQLAEEAADEMRSHNGEECHG